MLEPFRKLLDIEEAGATDNVLLKSVIDKLVLLLEHAGNVKGEWGDIKTQLEFKTHGVIKMHMSIFVCGGL